MKRLFTMFATLVVAIAMSGVASAQRGHGSGGGRPATTGLDHAETKANSHGQRGIENAESKQARHKGDNDKDNDKRKHKKHKRHHRS